MLTVPTPKDRSTARVIQDTLEMESRVKVFWSRQLWFYGNCIALLPLFTTINFPFIQISVNVTGKGWPVTTAIIPIIVMTMQIAPIPKDHSTARVIRDTPEMESFATVDDTLTSLYILTFMLSEKQFR